MQFLVVTVAAIIVAFIYGIIERDKKMLQRRKRRGNGKVLLYHHMNPAFTVFAKMSIFFPGVGGKSYCPAVTVHRNALSAGGIPPYAFRYFLFGKRGQISASAPLTYLPYAFVFCVDSTAVSKISEVFSSFRVVDAHNAESVVVTGIR